MVSFGSLVVTPLPAAAAPPAGQGPAGKSTPVRAVKGSGSAGASSMGKSYKPVKPVWPSADSRTVALPGAAAGFAAKPGRLAIAAGTVSVGVPALPAAEASPTFGNGSRRLGGTDPASVPPTPAAAVTVTQASHTTAAKAGAAGVLFSVKRADDVAGDTPVDVSISYAGFAAAEGANYGARLQLVELPACAMTTPDDPDCEITTSIPSTNNPDTDTVSATVTATAPADTVTAPVVRGAAVLPSDTTTPVTDGGMVFALASGPSSQEGDFRQSPLSAAAEWSQGASAGDFDYTYPMAVPPSASGLNPTVQLSYSSAQTDGETNAASAQDGWIGEGWSYSPGYITREYRTCADDTVDVPAQHYTNSTADNCWRDYNATLVWNGHSTPFVLDDTTNKWSMTMDDGTRIDKITGPGNGSHNNETWRLVTEDGTQYYFGLNEIPGWTSGAPQTNSVATIPVYGNGSSEPCYSSTSFAASHCAEAYQWNLDYVVDRHGNTISYWYTRQTNFTGLDTSTTSVAQYDRGLLLSKIEYGTTYGTETASGFNAPEQVVFTPGNRCLSSCGTVTSPTTANWPDTPFDLRCTGSPCDSTDSISPSFWLDQWLSSVKTQVWNGTGYTTVDEWDLAHTFPDPTDGTSPSAWLSTITHTGSDGGTLALPATTFTGTLYANRTDYNVSAGVPQMYHERLTKITTETGGQILVGYTTSDCTLTNTPPADDSQNTRRCFPQYYSPPGGSGAGFGWWNKYIVHTVTQHDPLGGSPDVVTTYAYAATSDSQSSVLWHHNDDWITIGTDRSWSDWRGYPQVTTTVGSGSTAQKTVDLYFRGMNGDSTSTGTRSAVVTDSAGDVWLDSALRQGYLRERDTYNNGTETTREIYTPGSHQTASRTMDPGHASPDSFTANIRWTTGDSTYTWLAGSSTWRNRQIAYTYDTYGRQTLTTDNGDMAVTGDEVCTATSYAQNTTGSGYDGTTAYIIDFPDETTTTDCASSPASADYLNDARTYYDGSSTLGVISPVADATKTTALSSWTGSTGNYVQTGSMLYDTVGRLKSVTDALGRVTSTAYTPLTASPVTSVAVTDPMGFVTTEALDPLRGVPLTVSDPNSHVTTGAYDPLGRLTSVWQPGRSTSLSPNTQYTYTVSNSAPSWIETQALGPNGNQIASYAIVDSLLRPRQTQATAPDGNRTITDTAYNANGLVAKQSTFYNAAVPSSTMVTAADSAIDEQERYTYDGLAQTTANQTYSDNVLQFQTTATYDGDRVNLTPPTGGTATTTIWDADGRTSALRQYHAATPTGTYDTTSYAYDRLSRPTQLTSPAGSQWTTSYNVLGEVSGSTDPDGGTTSFGYDNAGQVTSTTDAKSTTIAYTYDLDGRETGEYLGSTSGTQLTGYVYDTLADGQLTSSTTYNAGNAYTTAVTGYDQAYQPTGTSITLPSVEGAIATTPYAVGYTYNVDESLATTTLPAAGDLPTETLTSTYTTQGLPASVSGATTYTSGLSYAFDGAPLTDILGVSGTSIKQTNTYDPATRRQTTAYTGTEHPGTPGTFDEVATNTYGYDNAGDVTSINETTGGTVTADQCFTYDYAQRLTQAWTTTASTCQITPTQGIVGGTDPYWQTYTYDLDSDRTSKIDHAATGDTTHTYNYPTATSNQPHAVTTVTTGSNTDTYAYDANGNTTGRTIAGVSQTRTYDADNRLATVVQGGQTTSYVYDAAGNRLISHNADGTTTAYLGADELTQTGTVVHDTRYYGVAIRTAAGLTWTITDPNGTGDTAVNATTLTVTHRRLDPFGNPRNAAETWPTSKGFLDDTNDPTGTTHIGAREYDPNLGRFTSLDPVLEADSPQQLNGYGYAAGNPVTISDPTGLTFDGGDFSWGEVSDGGGGGSVEPGGGSTDTAMGEDNPEVDRLFEQSWEHPGPDYRLEQLEEDAASTDAEATAASSESSQARQQNIQNRFDPENGTDGGTTDVNGNNRGGTTDASGNGGTTDATGNGGTTDASGNGGTTDASGNDGTGTDASNSNSTPKIIRGTNAKGLVNSRAKFWRKTLKFAWDSMKSDPNNPGAKLCPTCGKTIRIFKGTRGNPRDWDVSHNPSWSNRWMFVNTVRKVWIELYNSGVFGECVACNRGGGNNDGRFGATGSGAP
jgi:RHS repeat-associated protein